jgi:hypothetical protein
VRGFCQPPVLDLPVRNILPEGNCVEGETVLGYQHTVSTDFHGMGNCGGHGAVDVFTDLQWLLAPDFQKVGGLRVSGHVYSLEHLAEVSNGRFRSRVGD